METRDIHAGTSHLTASSEQMGHDLRSCLAQLSSGDRGGRGRTTRALRCDVPLMAPPEVGSAAPAVSPTEGESEEKVTLESHA